ncbi:Nucleoside diphosphate-linked moiety X motif 8 mitochondrial [Fasciola gigantica]|uniref:Nucleoside diphosphate-linked moiety X motif 8 mitochondrial n=1 Tax=Fasciola gigantica TaxID=46835 RepID=A0A504YPD7_FASGI|nr:Nucleoside diphosphate-linked moiety X motif 8 mitochondrial [Fasciola gigantica]
MIPLIFGSENKARCIEELKKLRPYVVFRKVTKPAAVLIPLCIVRNVPAIMFLRRSMRLRTHPGEIGFPGGKCDPHDDGDMIRTALRETQEEIGIDPESVDIWYQLPRMDGRSSLYPILGFCGHVTVPEDEATLTTFRNISAPLGSAERPHQLRLNVDEVSYAFFRSVDWLCDVNNLAHTDIRARSVYSFQSTEHRLRNSDPPKRDSLPHHFRYVLPAYGNLAHTGSPGPRIWGLTAIMTYRVLHCLIPHGGPYPPNLPMTKLLDPLITGRIANSDEL